MNRRTILIVEDDASILDVTKIILEDEGHKVVFAQNVSAFDKIVAQKKPDMIFVDLWLGKESGEDLIWRLKADKNYKDIPTIIISASHDLKQIALSCGADSYLAKPFDIEDLVKTVRRYL